MMQEDQIRKLFREVEKELLIYADHGKPSGGFWYARFEGMRDVLAKVLEDDLSGVKCRVLVNHMPCGFNATGRVHGGIPRCAMHGGPPS